MESGKTIPPKGEKLPPHSLKAQSPIYFKELGNVMDDKPLPKNAESPMDTKELENTISFN